MVELLSTGACGITPAIRVDLSLTQVVRVYKPDYSVWFVFSIQGAVGSKNARALSPVILAVGRILAELHGRGVAIRASTLDGVSGMPSYDRLLDLLGELETEGLADRPHGDRSGFAITQNGLALLVQRDLAD